MPSPYARLDTTVVLQGAHGRMNVLHLEKGLILATQHDELGYRAERLQQLEQIGLGDLVPDVPDVDHLGRLRHPAAALVGGFKREEDLGFCPAEGETEGRRRWREGRRAAGAFCFGFGRKERDRNGSAICVS